MKKHLIAIFLSQLLFVCTSQATIYKSEEECNKEQTEYKPGYPETEWKATCSEGVTLNNEKCWRNTNSKTNAYKIQEGCYSPEGKVEREKQIREETISTYGYESKAECQQENPKKSCIELVCNNPFEKIEDKHFFNFADNFSSNLCRTLTEHKAAHAQADAMERIKKRELDKRAKKCKALAKLKNEEYDKNVALGLCNGAE